MVSVYVYTYLCLISTFLIGPSSCNNVHGHAHSHIRPCYIPRSDNVPKLLVNSAGARKSGYKSAGPRNDEDTPDQPEASMASDVTHADATDNEMDANVDSTPGTLDVGSVIKMIRPSKTKIPDNAGEKHGEEESVGLRINANVPNYPDPDTYYALKGRVDDGETSEDLKGKILVEFYKNFIHSQEDPEMKEKADKYKVLMRKVFKNNR